MFQKLKLYHKINSQYMFRNKIWIERLGCFSWYSRYWNFQILGKKLLLLDATWKFTCNKLKQPIFFLCYLIVSLYSMAIAVAICVTKYLTLSPKPDFNAINLYLKLVLLLKTFLLNGKFPYLDETIDWLKYKKRTKYQNRS